MHTVRLPHESILETETATPIQLAIYQAELYRMAAEWCLRHSLLNAARPVAWRRRRVDAPTKNQRRAADEARAWGLS